MSESTNQMQASSLKEGLRQLFHETEVPLKLECRRLHSASVYDDIFSAEFANLFVRFVLLGGPPTASQNNLYAAIFQAVHPRVYKVLGGENIGLLSAAIARFQERERDPLRRRDEKPLLLELAENADRANGTSYRIKVGQMFYRVASTAVTTGTEITPEAEAALAAFELVCR